LTGKNGKKPEKRAAGPERRKDFFSFKLRLIMLCLALVSGIVLVRAFVLAGVESEKLAAMARQEYRQVVTLNPDRGLIYDRHGEELAVSVQVESIFLRPAGIQDRAKASRVLARVLKMDQRAVMGKLTSRQPFVWLKRQVEPEVADRIKELDLAGVGVIPESRRFYPHRELAAHVLGFTGVDSAGLEGLEKGYDDILRGQSSQYSRKRDARGRPIYISEEGPVQQTKGHDLVLTLDKRIQYLAQRALAQAVADHRARSGLILVLDPVRGDVLALAGEPVFNPNVYRTSPDYTWRNRVLTDPFEPGSTFKVFTLAAALEEGLVSPKSRIDCENGVFRVGRNTIHDIHPHQVLSVTELLSFSSNIGAAKIALKLGPGRLHRRLTAFGFGQLTGIDLPGESKGLLAPPERWRKIDTANIGFGQGVAVTAVQLAAALGAVANKGVLMRPRVVSRIIGPDGKTKEERRPEAVGRVMSAATAAKLIKMMEGVVTEDGTGTQAKTPGYRVAGKTGTAQKLDPATGTYSNKKHLALFMGLAPAEKPALVILVVIDEPKDSPYGGVVAAPVFATVAQESLRHLGVPPSDPQLLVVKDEEEPSGVRTAGAGSGSARSDSPPARPDPADLLTARRNKRMPSLVGLSLRQALDAVAPLGLKLEIEGSGVVTWQSPEPGRDLKGVRSCRLKLEAERS